MFVRYIRYYGFEHATMVPLCRKLIDTSQLSQEEKVWIDGVPRYYLREDEGRARRSGVEVA